MNTYISKTPLNSAWDTAGIANTEESVRVKDVFS